jgi:hypothetical protein
MTKRNRHFWIEVTLLILVTAAIATAIIASEMRPLNKNDIKMNASDIRSFAATARRLNEQHEQQQLTEQFFDAQVELLSEKVEATKESLETVTEPDAENDRREAADLSTQLSNAVDEMAAGDDSAQTFATVESRSRQLEDCLSQ